MLRFFTSRFLMLVVITACSTVCLASEPVDANWFSYSDDFTDSNKVENDSYYHSIFWPQGAFPPSEPYLYHQDTGILGFGGFKGQDKAQIVYRFPFEQDQYIKAVYGELKVDIFFPYENSGSKQELFYSLSNDGINWSPEKKLLLASGINTKTIELESIRGICYVKFSGIGVLIDNLNIVLNEHEADRYVPSQYSTIQAAINDANEGDIIEVAEGTYKGTGNCNLNYKGKSIKIYSEKGPEKTIIDCENNFRGIFFHQGEDSNSVLCGFTIKNGKRSGLDAIGAGIYCQLSNPSIVDCIIQDCSTKFGGGIALLGASPYITDCVIKNCNSDVSGGYGAGIAIIQDSNAVIVNTIIQDNTGYYENKGAGIYCSESQALFANCEIRNNTENSSGNLIGGGVYARGNHTDIELRNCIIADNTAHTGAGVFTDSIKNLSGLNLDNVLLTNCTIAYNKISGAKNDTIGGGIHSISSNIIVKNSIIWGNDSENIFIENAFSENPIRYSNVQGGYEEGEEIINIDPCFASVAAGDYHLKSKAFEGRYDPVQGKWVQDTTQSLCIDAGNSNDEIAAEQFPHGKRINQGAYGGTEYASKNELTQYIFHVAKTGNDDNSGLNKEDAFLTIQHAVNTAIDGDVVMIWPGIYVEDVSFAGKAITIQSADEPAEVRAAHDYAFTFTQGLYRDTILRNLIITNSSYGAIFCEGASPTLTNLTIAHNGYGVYTGESGSSPIIKHCIFYNNTYGDFYEQDLLIRYNITFCRLGGYSYSKVSDKITNFSDDPRFANPDKNNGDYHLQSQSYLGRYSSILGDWIEQPDPYHSRCIDAGDKELTVGREPMFNNGIINIGAYGGTPYASKSLE